MIQIDRQVIAANHLIVSVDQIHITGIADGRIMAIVKYIVKNEFGILMETESLIYKTNEYNDWWEKFDSGTFLLEEYAKKHKLENVAIDAKVLELKFKNSNK